MSKPYPGALTDINGVLVSIGGSIDDGEGDAVGSPENWYAYDKYHYNKHYFCIYDGRMMLYHPKYEVL